MLLLFLQSSSEKYLVAFQAAATIKILVDPKFYCQEKGESFSVKTVPSSAPIIMKIMIIILMLAIIIIIMSIMMTLSGRCREDIAPRQRSRNNQVISALTSESKAAPQNTHTQSQSQQLHIHAQFWAWQFCMCVCESGIFCTGRSSEYLGQHLRSFTDAHGPRELAEGRQGLWGVTAAAAAAISGLFSFSSDRAKRKLVQSAANLCAPKRWLPLPREPPANQTSTTLSLRPTLNLYLPSGCQGVLIEQSSLHNQLLIINYQWLLKMRKCFVNRFVIFILTKKRMHKEKEAKSYLSILRLK